MEPARDRFTPRAEVIFAERFRLVREIGRGGMATVWLAHHLGLDSPCAVKFVGETFSHPSARQRFEREARAAARLRSPHVVQVFDCGVWEDVPYIAMEYLQGEDLSTRLGRVGRLSVEETFPIAAQVGRALSKAHAEMIVHRDLKPANIFLVREDDREFVKVLDFGIAKIVQAATGNTLQEPGLVGTPQYMSPEQADGKQAVDHRTDLWALAVIVFQCLTGVSPFAAEDVTACLLKIVSEPIPVPSTFPVGLPVAFDAWWARAVSRDREERFGDAKQLISSLAAVLGIEDPDRTVDSLRSTTMRRLLPSVEPQAPTVRVVKKVGSGVIVLVSMVVTAVAVFLGLARFSGRGAVPRRDLHAPAEGMWSQPAEVAGAAEPPRAAPEPPPPPAAHDEKPAPAPAKPARHRSRPHTRPKVDLGF
jgi:serine/threonine-protein kinase